MTRRPQVKETIISILFCAFFLISFNVTSQNHVVGSKSYVHLEQINNVWWIVDGDGKKFISKGMNHIGPSVRFAAYNKEFWSDKFGENILVNNKVSFKATKEVQNWMHEVVKNHKDYNFNTIAFHRPTTIDDTFFDELNLYYLGKIKTGDLHAGRAKNSDGFPDVFSTKFIKHAEEVAKKYCTKHKTSKFLIGYTYDDLPSYSYEEYNRKYKKKDKEFHPWILKVINNGSPEGEQAWLEVLKKNYKTPAEVASNYNLNITSWKAILEVSNWKKPNDIKK